VTEVSDNQWQSYSASLDGKAMIYLSVLGFFMPFMFGGVLIPLLYFEFGLSALIFPLGLILIFVFIAVMMAARQYEKKDRAQLILGIVSHVTEPTRISSAARSVGLRHVAFVRVLSELIMHDVVDLQIYPAYDAFGPPGMSPKEVPPDPVQDSGYMMGYSTGWPTTLRWVGIVGTILSILVSAIYLGQFLIQLLGL
jgi:hypothetical protein